VRRNHRAVKKALLLTAALGASFSVHAAGLGRLTVLSGLGQPLRAEIEVVSLQKGEAESLQARLAPPEAFQQAGVDYAQVLSSLRFEVKEQSDGHYVIVMTSLQPVNDPFVDVLVELDWATGRLVRQFVFLLDPLEYQANKSELNVPTARPQVSPQPVTAGSNAAPAASATPAPSASVSAPAAAAAATAATPAAATPAAEAGASATPPAAPARRAQPAAAAAPAAEGSAAKTEGTLQEGSQYVVKPGDTLARIAGSVRPQDVSLDQMLVALYRANEDAFINKNMNLLRVGKVLTMPAAQTARDIPVSEAHQTLVAQGQEWLAYRRQIADRAARQAGRETSAGQTASGRISAEVRETQTAPSDRVRLGTDRAGAASGAVANGDEATARARELHEMQNRVADLEKNLKDMSAALAMKNQQLAELQKANEAKAKAPAQPAQPAPAAQAPASQAPAAPTPTPGVPAPAAQAPVAPAPAIEPPRPAVEPRAEKQEAPKTPETSAPAAQGEPAQAPENAAPTPPAVQPTPPKPAPPVVKPPVREEPGFFDTLMDDVPLIGAIVAALLAVVGGLWWYRRKKTEKIEDTLMSAAGTDASSVFGSTGGRTIDTAASSQQTDFSQSGIGAIDTDEVDPVAEADVYMAYGRDAQAEEILKEALQKDPSKHAVRGKLLEIYAARKDVKAFETTAGELFAATHGQGTEWERAAALGAQLDPANPMYGPTAAPAGDVRTDAIAHAAGASTMPAHVQESMMPGGHDDATTIVKERREPTMGEAETLIRPDLPDMHDLPELRVPSRAPDDLGFDLNLGDGTEKTVPAGLDLELPETGLAHHVAPPTQPVAAPAAAAKAPLDFGGINLDLGPIGSNGSVGADARWQEVATKLDLAKAYHEMGDRDGARELLGEVAKEGDAAQQQQARKLLETIG
jgi:pilus assembly protein FimV